MKKRIEPDFFKEYVNVSDLKPNGRGLFTYVRSDVDMEGDRYCSNLYLYDMERRETKAQLTFDGTVGAHEWLDEENLIILGARTEEDRREEERGIPLCVFNRFQFIPGSTRGCLDCTMGCISSASLTRGIFCCCPVRAR